MVMLTLLNAQERTEAEFRELFRQVDEGFVFKVRFDVFFFSPLSPLQIEFLGRRGVCAGKFSIPRENMSKRKKKKKEKEIFANVV